MNLVGLASSMKMRQETSLIVLSAISAEEYFWADRALRGQVVNIQGWQGNEHIIPTNLHGFIHRVEVLDPRVALGAKMMANHQGDAWSSAPQTGILALHVAMQICHRVTAFGFRYQSGLKAGQTHYYKNESAHDRQNMAQNHGGVSDHDNQLRILDQLKLIKLVS